MTDDALLAEFEQRKPLALRIARAFVRRLPPSVQRADVEQAAIIGLWQALRSDRQQTHPGFEWYVRVRIRGAIIDELRAQDWLPRRARTQLERRHITLVHLEDIRSDVPWAERVVEPTPSPEHAAIVRRETNEALRAPLTERERLVILRAMRGHKLLEIARELGVSEARISQIQTRAIAKMRAHLSTAPTASTKGRVP